MIPDNTNDMVWTNASKLDRSIIDAVSDTINIEMLNSLATAPITNSRIPTITDYQSNTPASNYTSVFKNQYQSTFTPQPIYIELLDGDHTGVTGVLTDNQKYASIETAYGDITINIDEIKHKTVSKSNVKQLEPQCISFNDGDIIALEANDLGNILGRIIVHLVIYRGELRFNDRKFIMAEHIDGDKQIISNPTQMAIVTDTAIKNMFLVSKLKL